MEFALNGADGRTDALMVGVVDILYRVPYILRVILSKVVLWQPVGHLLGRRRQLAGIVHGLSEKSIGWIA